MKTVETLAARLIDARQILSAMMLGSLVVGPQVAHAQDLQINQRFTAPTAHAQAYAGLTLSQLVLALGLSLQGVPYTELQHDVGRSLELRASGYGSRRHIGEAHPEPHTQIGEGLILAPH